MSAILAKDEAASDRYLSRVLSRCLAFSDTVVLLDDRSTDKTASVAADMGCEVRIRSTLDARAWGNESSARKELWDFACEYATTEDDWVLICDADQEMVGNVRDLARSRDVNTWSFILYDLWSETEYRVDGQWQGHAVARPWMFAPHRVPPKWTPVWSARGIHTGHCPTNWSMVGGIAPPDTYFWKHYSYMKPEHRVAKHQQYLAQKHLLSPSELSHAESIIA